MVGRYAQLVIGPAGCGKSTYCSQIKQHCASLNRTVFVVNLDPAAESFDYDVAVDVRQLINVPDVMEQLGLGPNGALLHCMEYLDEHAGDWLREELDAFGDDDYILFDCPGQIELYSHVPVFPALARQLRGWDFSLCCVYVMDAHFAADAAKFISGGMAALAAMVALELPHVNVLTKMDIVRDKAAVERFLEPDARSLIAELDAHTPPAFARLNEAVAALLDEYALVSFVPLDISDDDSIAYVLSLVDHAIQFGEDADVRVPRDPVDDGEGGMGAEDG